MPSNPLFAGYSTVHIREAPAEKGKRLNHLLWGDYCTPLGEKKGNWIKIRGRGTVGWVKEEEMQEERLLEGNFVDIGQGDGSFIVTPDDRFIVIDAGQRDNMFRFLRWRFNLRRNKDRKIRIDTAVLSHPDADHYAGFGFLVKSKHFHFSRVFHNGIVERASKTLPLGPRMPTKGRTHVATVADLDALNAVLGNAADVAGKSYPILLRSFLECADDIRMLCSEDGFVPGYEKEKDLSLEVLGPVPEQIDGKRGVRWFTDPGKTKNGHSVVLKLRYKQLTMLLGGDLNIPAENHLLSHYTGMDPKDADEDALVAKARERFSVDIAKACHHGSADFSIAYLRAVN